jgi:hypothetical protein
MATDGRESPRLTAGTWKRTDPELVSGPDREGPTVVGPAAPRAQSDGVAGDQATRYLHEIRNWMRFIGIIVIINVVAAIVIGIVVGVEVSHAVNNSNPGGTTPNSNCLSQGGTDPNC